LKTLSSSTSRSERTPEGRFVRSAFSFGPFLCVQRVFPLTGLPLLSRFLPSHPPRGCLLHWPLLLHIQCRFRVSFVFDFALLLNGPLVFPSHPFCSVGPPPGYFGPMLIGHLGRSLFLSASFFFSPFSFDKDRFGSPSCVSSQPQRYVGLPHSFILPGTSLHKILFCTRGSLW